MPGQMMCYYHPSNEQDVIGFRARNQGLLIPSPSPRSAFIPTVIPDERRHYKKPSREYLWGLCT